MCPVFKPSIATSINLFNKMSDQFHDMFKPYRQMRGFCTPNDENHIKNAEKRKEKIHDFFNKREAFFKDIISENEARGIEIKASRTGDGLFNGPNSIPNARQLAYLIAVIDTVTYDSYFEEDRSYTWYANWMGRDCVFNGRHALATHRHPVNLSFANHSCTPNCTVMCERDVTGVPFWVLSTSRVIPPGEELCFDYGKGYFEKARRLKDVPPEHIQHCCCAQPCPSGRAFDKRVIYQSFQSPGWWRRQRAAEAEAAEAEAAESGV